MTVPLLLAGCLALLGAGVHGVAGELMVMRRITAADLPAGAFGSARMTRTMLHVTWHLTTVAFLAVGVTLVVAGAALDGDVRRAVGLVCAATATSFAAVIVVLGGAARSPRALLTHPGPAILTATAALAWWGALTA